MASDTFNIRYATAAAWAAVNPIVAQGQILYETDTLKWALGDGATAYASLKFVGTIVGVSSTMAQFDAACSNGNFVYTGLGETVNASAVSTPNFNDSTPIPATNGTNVKWQIDASVPTNVSAYVPNLIAGTYSPTRSAEANMDGNVTVASSQYLMVGATVMVSGRFTADPTLAATATSFEITLPIASNIGAVEDCAGVAACGAIAGMVAAVTGSVANNTAVVSWIASDVTSQSWSFHFSYQVI